MSLSDELVSLSSVEMRRRIGTKEVSPVELVEASIARIEALNPTVNAIAATDFAHARKLAAPACSGAIHPTATSSIIGRATPRRRMLWCAIL
jgi:Asp-tRNA(Asn)/Glu-tRNA(Gln) amidotransferase A subunit family amidase